MWDVEYEQVNSEQVKTLPNNNDTVGESVS